MSLHLFSFGLQKRLNHGGPVATHWAKLLLTKELSSLTMNIIWLHCVTEKLWISILILNYFKLGITFIFVSVTYSLICLYLSILGILKYKSENIFNFKTEVCCEVMMQRAHYMFMGVLFFKSFIMKHFFSVLQKTFYMIQHWAIYFGGIFMSLIWFRFFGVSFLHEEFLS